MIIPLLGAATRCSLGRLHRRFEKVLEKVLAPSCFAPSKCLKRWLATEETAHAVDATPSNRLGRAENGVIDLHVVGQVGDVVAFALAVGVVLHVVSDR